MSINRSGTAWRGALVPRRNGQCYNVTTYWCRALSPFAELEIPTTQL